MYLGYYTPVLLLQGFCLYHAYSQNTQQKWFYLIVFLPLVGCLIYLYIHFFGNLKKGIGGLTEGAKGLVNQNYQVDQLKKEFNFSDTTENKIRLADAYTEKGRYEDALELYKSCEKGIYAEDAELLLKFLKVYYLHQNYKKAVEYGFKLKNMPEFKKAPEKIAFAWALHYDGDDQAAEVVFKEMDHAFSNYPNRLEYCRFLLKKQETEQAKAKLNTLMNEIDHLDYYERKPIKAIANEIKQLYNSLK